MTAQIDISKAIARESWGSFFDRFSESNRGRPISVEVLGAEIGDQELIQHAPLLAVIYDRLGKGDNLMIEVGQDEMTYAHTIKSPTEVLTGQNLNGVVLAVSITDATGVKTFIKLQAA